MRFNVSSSDLLKHLQIANGVIAANPVVPILEDFLFRVRLGHLEIVASDLETTISTVLNIISDEEGDVAIPAKILIETLKALPGQPITFFVDPVTNKIEITSAYGKYQMGGENGADFPNPPIPDTVESIALPAAMLQAGINNSLFATSSDELRPAMTGVYFDVDFSKISLVATDAHKLVRNICTGMEGSLATTFILPKKTLNLIKNALPDNGEVQIAFNKTNVFISFDSISIVSRLIDARYPDYNAVIPVDNPNRLSINRADLMGSVKRIAIFANKTTNQVVFNLSEGSLTITAQDLDFNNEAMEQLPCSYAGDPITIGFNAKFLSEMLSVLACEELIMEFSTPNRAVLLHPSEQEPNLDILMLIMPVMLNS